MKKAKAVAFQSYLKPAKLWLLWLIVVISPLQAEQELLDKLIRLKGDLSFSDIITQAEQQLSIQIELPSRPDDNSKKKYEHRIRFKTLLGAIREQYSAEGIRVTWSIDQDERTVHILRKKKTISRAPTKAHQAPPPRKPPVRAQVKKNPPPEKTKKAYTSLFNSSRSSDVVVIPHKNIEMDSFTVKIPRNRGFATHARKPLLQRTARLELDTSLLPSSSSNEVSSNLEVTSYPVPENDSSFWNDAPSITPEGIHESFFEWSTRMKGLVDQGNRPFLDEERRSLEKRIRWLRANTSSRRLDP